MFAAGFVGCSQKREWNHEQRKAMREALRSYRQMVYLDDLTDAEFVLFTDQVAGELEGTYPVYATFVEMPGVTDTVDMVVVTTIVDELNADARNMRHIFPYNYLVAQGVLPAGLDHDQQKAFYNCFAGKVNDTYDTMSQFINAILADVYLWRASMTGNLDDYDKCVDYCDAVIESKKARYLSDNQASGPSIIGNIDHDGYPLYPGEYAYQYNFIQGNSMESIFELQLDGENISNSGLMHCYWNYDDKARTYGLMMAPASRFATAGDGNVFIKDKDYRWFESCFNVQSADATQLTVFKMVSPTGTDNTEASLKPVTAVITPGYTKIDQNWIVYRLTDVMLMKAEALVQLEASDANNLQRAFSIVNTVNKRSLAISSPTATDTLQFSSYNSKSAMEQLVLEERQRELCFEGKRWFDLMRYTYRSLRSGDANDQSALLHPDMLLSEMGGLSNMAKTSTILGNILGSDVQMSMESEPYLYFPVKQSEMKVNFLLKQNPAYEKMESIQKQ